MFLKCKIYLNIFILCALVFSNYSYEGLLLPSLPSEITNINSYKIDKDIILALDSSSSITSSLIILPNDIYINSFHYYFNVFQYSATSNFTIINYGSFSDSESGHTFSSKDIIFKNQLIHQIQNDLYITGTLKYMHSNIGSYKSSLISLDFSSYYHKNNFLFNVFLNNYGFILDSYTSYKEDLPTSYGGKISYNLYNINLLMLCNYQIFSNYSEINFNNQFFISDQYSISIGYTSLAKNLYSGDFNNDFLVGFNLGASIIYNNYIIDFGFKNLGSIGYINAISLSKSFN